MHSEHKSLTSTPSRDAILSNAWKRSEEFGLCSDGDLGDLPRRAIDVDHQLFRAADSVLGDLKSDLGDELVGILITDRNGIILGAVAGHHSVRESMYSVRAEPGVSYSEQMLGTNAVGTAIESRLALTVLGDEHFNESMREFACFARPLCHPRTGRLLGAVNMCAHIAQESALNAAFVNYVARQVGAAYHDLTFAAAHALAVEYEDIYARYGGAVMALSSEATYMSRDAAGLIESTDLEALQLLADQESSTADVIFELPSGLQAMMVDSGVNQREGIVLRLWSKADRPRSDQPGLPLTAADPLPSVDAARPPQSQSAQSARPTWRGMDQIERQAIVDALRAAEGEKSAAARSLEVSRRTIYNKIARFKIYEWEYAR